jgi:phosphate starvation-inducible protein PhoH
MLMLTTRIGLGSKMVVTGDLKQSDKGLDSGLNDFINKFKVYEKRESEKYNSTEINSGIKMVELTNEDIERSPVIIKILDVYSVNDVAVEKKQVFPKVTQVADFIGNFNEKKENDAAMIPSDPLEKF